MNKLDIEYTDIIKPDSDTRIKDKKLIEFLNSIKSGKLRRILRYYIEDRCFFENYRYETLVCEFKEYLSDKNTNNYFLPDMNDRLEEILKMLLKL